MSHPVIGILGDYRAAANDEEFRLKSAYFDAVEAAGGAPLLLPPCRSDETMGEMLRHVKALVIPGGQDLPSARCRQTLHPASVPVHPRRDDFDFRCLSAALELGLPLLAICYGHQALNLHLGGTLIQHLTPAHTRGEEHRLADGNSADHAVSLAHDSELARILGVTELEVNSTHHQAVARPGEGLLAVAHSPAGVLEAVESSDDRFLLGLQWHPEKLHKRPEHMRIFQALVQAARHR